MRGILPDKVLSRPKSPLRRELWSERVLAQGRPKLVACEELERYIDLERFAKSGERDEDFWTDFRVASLSFWLANKNARQTRTEKAR